MLDLNSKDHYSLASENASRTLKVYIGCTGFNYQSWFYKKGGFYPVNIKKGELLEYYSTQFPCCEINSTFYRIPTLATTTNWALRLPEHFIITAKIPQSISHSDNISAHKSELDSFLLSMLPLKKNLGPLLLQLPPSFEKNKKTTTQLENFVEQFPLEKFQLVIEFRHKTWKIQEVIDFLNANNIGIVSSFVPYIDFELFKESKTKYFYIRLIGSQKTPIESGNEIIDRTKHMEKILLLLNKVAKIGTHKQFALIFTNNHYTGYAPEAAKKLMSLAQKIQSLEVVKPTTVFKGQYNLETFFEKREEK